MEPSQEELEVLIDSEERDVLEDAEVPDDVKGEIAERLESYRQADREAEQAEDAGNTP